VVSSEHSTNDGLGRSTLAEIQSKIVKKGKRNAVSRLLHAKNDKETIATWKSDLSKILLVFNVRSVIVVWLLLTVRSQTELAINTYVTVSDIRDDVATTHTIVSNVQNGVTSTHTMVSDIHHIMTKNQGGANGNNLPVSIARTLFITE
jgi:hypothetical protein